MSGWHYVGSDGKHGPVDEDFIKNLISEKKLKEDDYVWTKGFDNWKKIKDIPELMKPAVEVKATPAQPVVAPAPTSSVQASSKISESINLSTIKSDAKVIFIRIGVDRGEQKPAEYGPFSSEMLKKLFNENRINGKTEYFIQGMSSWKMLGEDPAFENIFHEMPPIISDEDKRSFPRKPFMARMFIANNKKLFEGICRDVSVGGMQVLIDNFPGRAGDKISINVHPENTDYNFTASGEIVRILEGGQGFSFRFMNLSQDAHNAINKYLSSH
jgi:hypothetical protein